MDARLSSVFASGKEPIRPLIWAHGLYCYNTFYKGLHLIMASHGFLVIAINFQDGSCLLTEDEDNKQILPQKHDFYTPLVR